MIGSDTVLNSQQLEQVVRKYHIYHCYIYSILFNNFKMVKGHHGHHKKIEPHGLQSRVIGHHLVQVEEIPTSGYRNMSSGRYTHGQKHETNY